MQRAQNFQLVNRMNKFILIGGAGFIGSHFAQKILEYKEVNLTIIDNEISGSKDNLLRLNILSDQNLTYIQEDIMSLSDKDVNFNNSVVVNFAANPDISLSNVHPTIDFDRGTLVHNHVLELCRTGKAKQLIFTSGSGVYGDMSSKVLNEELGNLNVCSPYGANKLACEALSLAYSSMFDLQVRILRFGNVVGLNQTHGVGFDFIRRLIKDPKKLVVLGDGFQSKPYIFIDDVVEALLHVSSLEGKSIIANAASPDFISVREIASIVINELGLEKCEVEYGNTPYGWKGDVPILRLDSSFIESTGWKCKYNSRQAIKASVRDMVRRFTK